MNSVRGAISLGKRKESPADASSFSLQRDRSKEGDALLISVESLTRHVCIFGRTGAGKSFTGMVIARELLDVKGVATLILDRTGEFARSGLHRSPTLRSTRRAATSPSHPSPAGARTWRTISNMAWT